jgi:hypothetical protein
MTLYASLQIQDAIVIFISSVAIALAGFSTIKFCINIFISNKIQDSMFNTKNPFAANKRKAKK